MYLWADIYDPSYTSVVSGVQRINLVRAEIEAALDGPGTCRVEVPATDTRALTLMTQRRVVEVWFDSDTGDGKRLLTAFIIEEDEYTDDTRQTRRIGGPDVLSLLRGKVTATGGTFTADALTDVIDTEINRGGTFVFEYPGLDPDPVINARFDGQTALRGLSTLTKERGLHFRLRLAGPGASNRKIEVGAFGADSDVRLVGLGGAAGLVHTNTDVALIERISIKEQSERLANRLYPRGGGSGDSFVSLLDSWLERQFDVDNPITIEGRESTPFMFYVNDAASEALYGVQEAQITFPEIVPVSNSEADVLTASEAVLTAALAELERTKQPQIVYTISVRKLDKTLVVGQKVFVNYRGTVYRDGVVTPTQSVVGWFWVLSVQESIGVNGQTVRVEVSNVDRLSQGAAGVVVGALDDIQVTGLLVQPYQSKVGFTYYETLDPTHPAVVPVFITDATQRLQRCIVRVQTRPFRATAKSAASVTSAGGGGQTTSSGGGQTTSSGGGQTSSAGGDHRHQVLDYKSAISSLPSGNYGVFDMARDGSASSLANVIIPDTFVDLWTFSSSGDHTHTVAAHTHTVAAHTHVIPAAPLEYGIVDDTEYPGGLVLYVNGKQAFPTDILGSGQGPWGDSSAPIDIELEISARIEDAPTLQQRHELEFRCATGQGRVLVQVELYEVIQNIRVSR